jgi:hypothetical protein
MASSLSKHGFDGKVIRGRDPVWRRGLAGGNPMELDETHSMMALS